jgi:hypothetical protein
METDENQKDYKQEKLCSLNPYAIIFDENQERVERGREEQRWSTSPNTHITAKDEASERSDTQKNMSAQTTCRVPRPRCTKCTKTSLKFSAMRLSPQEPRRRYGLQGTSIHVLRHDKTKRQEKIQVSPSFDPLAIATTEIREVESKEQQTPNKLRAQSISYWINGD